MKRFLRYAAIVLGGLMLFACNGAPDDSARPMKKIYVIASDDLSSSFTADLASVVTKYGLSPNVGRAVDDRGMTLHVLDAKGADIRLRSENVLLSGQGDTGKCGVHREPYPDPGQYFISVSFVDDTSGNGRAEKLLRSLSHDLQARGYQVRSDAMVCSGHSS